MSKRPARPNLKRANNAQTVQLLLINILKEKKIRFANNYLLTTEKTSVETQRIF
jgi:hypothetical protein